MRQGLPRIAANPAGKRRHSGRLQDLAEKPSSPEEGKIDIPARATLRLNEEAM